MYKKQKRVRSTKAQVKYQEKVIREKLEEFLKNPPSYKFHIFFEQICEYCENMSEEESKKWGKKFINYTEKDKLRAEQDRFQKTLNKIGYRREDNIIVEVITNTERNYSTMLYDALYYKSDIRLYSFKNSCMSALKIKREANIYKKMEQKDLYTVLMFFKPFSSSQYIMETLSKLLEKDCLGIGAFMGGIYIIFEEQKKQNNFVDMIKTLINKIEYKNVKLY